MSKIAREHMRAADALCSLVEHEQNCACCQRANKQIEGAEQALEMALAKWMPRERWWRRFAWICWGAWVVTLIVLCWLT